MGPLWQRQAGRTCVGPRPLWTSRKWGCWRDGKEGERAGAGESRSRPGNQDGCRQERDEEERPVDAPQAQGGLCWWPEGGGGRAHEGREVMLVRFRTGHHPVLRRWQAMVDESWWMNGGWIRGGDDGAPVAGVWGPGGGEAHFRPGRGAERINFQTYTVPGVTQDHPEKPGRCQLNKQANSNAINNLSPTKNIFKSSEFKPEIQLFK